MWLSERRTAAKAVRTAVSILATTAVLGCGFRPLYAPAGNSTDDSAAARLAAVHVDTIADREGQLLRNELVDLLDPGRLGQNTDYNLQVILKQNQSDVAYEDTGFATRANVRIEANYVLVQKSSGKTLTTGQSRIVTSYNITDSFFSTYTTAQAVRERSMQRIAHDIRRRLAAYFVSNPTAEPENPSSQTSALSDG